VYQGEHYVLTQLQRRKYISRGFIKSLKYFVALNEDRAIDLDAMAEKEES
jgi:lipopolysaccharide biosynthesis regulator YciM